MSSVIEQESGRDWVLFNGDCVDVAASLPDNSIHYSIFSPPYLELYHYSNSDRDLSNSRNAEEFWVHFGFLIDQLFRVIKPGRVVSVDCMNVPAMKERDGYIGLKDFRGDIIRRFQASGFIFHSEHCMLKDPLIEATRTKALGLMHKQLCKDSAMCRAGLAQYLVGFRKPGENPEPIAHPSGLQEFAGDDEPTEGVLEHQRWRRYASPVWNDIRFTRTLNARDARDEDDEKHICPMALDIIERGIHLWTNPGDVVFDPFTGIGSTGHVALQKGRKFAGSELKGSYYKQAVANLRSVEPGGKGQQLSILDMAG